jgi:hypothetical protein
VNNTNHQGRSAAPRRGPGAMTVHSQQSPYSQTTRQRVSPPGTRRAPPPIVNQSLPRRAGDKGGNLPAYTTGHERPVRGQHYGEHRTAPRRAPQPAPRRAQHQQAPGGWRG